jgi:acetyl-CoA carboxylase biotin carboxylase subunit
MFRTVLIANRGEIAVRVMRTCREMGIATVAVYSDADRNARHVLEADRAVHLGAAAPSESYLNADRIIAAARETGAEAVHPGYGFLSEKAAFAGACAEAGLVFIGPPPDAMRAMGSKIGARRLMQSSGVPVVPGETPADQSTAALVAALGRVGRPALVKPSAGGGGIGMRVVREGDDAEAAIDGARRDAEHAFRDGTLYVERLVERPRHVEIQIFADGHGNCVSLFERECSIQRRHQKVIEESPSPALTPELRTRMGEAAVDAARAVGYQNAGTVEFLLDASTAPEAGDASFYFLEMNTRLQVEHPVTELVTGLDLVRAQLLVAAGQPLPFRADRLSQRGHAIELRVYAEDPAAGFLPQAGPLLLYREPRGPGVRVDSGFAEGDAVSVHYDPLVAKLVVSAETRQAALARANRALREFVVLGITTNIALLRQLVQHPDVRAGRLDTGLLDRITPELSAAAPDDVPVAVEAVAALHASGPRTAGLRADGGIDPWSAGGWRP